METPTVERRRTGTWLTWVAAGLIIGAVECVLAIAFAAFVFGGGALVNDLPQGIGLYLGAAALTLAFFAWRAGHRGVVGSVQDAAAAVLSLVAAAVAKKVAELEHVAQQSRTAGLRATRHLPHRRRRDVPSDGPLRDRVLRDGEVPTRRPGPVRAVSGRRRVPRGHRVAAVQGRRQRVPGMQVRLARMSSSCSSSS